MRVRRARAADSDEFDQIANRPSAGRSGAAGVAAILAAMQHDFAPATINLDNPDPQCDLDYVPTAPRAAKIRVALCNCLGFGSKNAALVLKKWDES